MREFELIDDVLRRRLQSGRGDTRLAIGDDAALISPPDGQEVAVATDALIAGRHFHEDTPAEDVGYKSIMVNFSDLAAMGAEPAWLTLTLALPTLACAWCHAFVDGVLSALDGYEVDVIGGDTTRSAITTISVTAMGLVPAGRALRRDTAEVGDVIAVTGTLGDAAAGLQCWPERDQGTDDVTHVIRRLTRPTARQGAPLLGLAHAVVDLSDGLLADLGHILKGSGLGACLNPDRLPASPALQRLIPESRRRRRLQATGGEDYELCLTLSATDWNRLRQRMDCPLTAIGHIHTEPGLVLMDDNGERCDWLATGPAGWDHFSDLDTTKP